MGAPAPGGIGGPGRDWGLPYLLFPFFLRLLGLCSGASTPLVFCTSPKAKCLLLLLQQQQQQQQRQ